MELNEKQKEGLKIAVDRYNQGKSYTCISGYAGSGKSTLVKFIVAALNLDPEEDVAYVAFTGKAAEVLRHKGCPNATTAHKLLYTAYREPNGKFKFIAKPHGELDYKLIIVDEVSMLPLDLWMLLLSHRVPVIACGDPGQLPPVSKDADNHVLDNPHIFLDEIMRQAQDSEIIQLSMAVRYGENIPYTMGKDIRVLDPNQISLGLLRWPDQILCATNKKRQDINFTVRQADGRGANPEIGDKLICLENHWDIVDTGGDTALVNGTIGYIKKITKDKLRYYMRGMNKNVDIFRITLETAEGEIFEEIPIDANALLNGAKSLTPQEEYKIHTFNKKSRFFQLELPVEFNWGYAITIWKAQGSQWPKVLMIEEEFPYDNETHKKCNYTGITRAESKLIMVKKERQNE